jgi:hypothetical protein
MDRRGNTLSSARAEFFTPAGEFIGYGVYSGTSNVLSPGITPEVDWSGGGWERLKECQHEGEPAIVYSDYGGDHWPGTVCRECRVWKGHLSQYEPDYGYTLPSRDERLAWAAWHAAGWPKDGHPFPTWTPTEGAQE